MTASGPERWQRGELHVRVLELHHLVRRRAVLPRLVDSAIAAIGCDVDQLEGELHRLGRVLRRDYEGLQLPTLAGTDRAAVDLAAAGPLATMVIRTIAEVDAATVILLAVDPRAFDEALAAPIAAWTRTAAPRPTAPPLRKIAERVIATQATALRAFAAAPASAADDAGWQALEAIWQTIGALIGDATAAPRPPGVAAALLPALAAAEVAVVQLRTEIAARRRALRQLGADLDRRAGSTGAPAETALVIASRIREVVAVGDALVSHLAAVADRNGRDAGLAEAVGRWRDLVVAVATRLGRCLDAIDRLVGMEH